MQKAQIKKLLHTKSDCSAVLSILCINKNKLHMKITSFALLIFIIFVKKQKNLNIQRGKNVWNRKKSLIIPNRILAVCACNF